MSDKDIADVQEEGFNTLATLMNPFPGLRPFSVEESHLFFGREGQSDEVLTKLAENRFVGILGTSGSGKSSLMFCGLIPIMHGGFMTDAGSNWRVVVARPGVTPIENLSESLMLKDLDYASLSEEDRLIRKAITTTVLRSSSLGLIEAIKQSRRAKGENFLVLIDQFEELFRYNRIENRPEGEENESLSFVNLLLEAIDQREEPIYVALTMRSDFIGDCAQFPELTSKINDSHYLIPQMTREQKKLAIEGPVAVGGGRIAPRLSQQILNDVGDNPDQLPIMQHALMRTWSYWGDNHTGEEPLDLKHYNAIGRLTEALSLHANEAYDELSKREKKVCEIMFKGLTEAGNESVGIRRPTALGIIANIAGVNEDEVIRVVEKFREPGRTLLMPPYGVKLGSDTVIDISHESLMRNWTRLKSWVAEESTSAQMYIKLSEAAEAYQSGRAGLWRMPDLQLAVNWKEEQKPTLIWGQRYDPAFERGMVFLETSEKAYETEQANKERIQQRNLKRARGWAMGLGSVALITIFLVVFAFTKQAEAEKQTALAKISEQLANEQRELADQQRKEADIAREEADVQRVAAEAAEAQAQKERDAAEVARQDAVKAQAEAEIQRHAAERQKVIAERQQKIAEEQTVIAEKQTKIANEQRLAAERLRYQSVAKSMAIKSLQITDTVQRALIAQQSFNFNITHGGSIYEPDIYSGLFSALQLLKGDTLNHLKGHVAAVKAMAFGNTDDLYTAGADGMIFKWNLESQDYTRIDSAEHPARALAVSPNDQWLAAGYANASIKLFNMSQPGSEPRVLNPHQSEVVDIKFMPDNSGFISTSTDSTIQFYDFQSFRQIAKVNLKVNRLAIHPEGKLLAGALSDGTVGLWDLAKDNELSFLDIPKSEQVNTVTFSHNGRLLAVGNEEGQLRIYDMILNNLYADIPGHSARISDLDFSNDDKILATASWDNTAHIYIVDKINELPIVLSSHDNWLWGVTFSPDGEILITGANDRIVRAWPTDASVFAGQFCDEMARNLSGTEWVQYVGDDLKYEKTCGDLPEGEGSDLLKGVQGEPEGQGE